MNTSNLKSYAPQARKDFIAAVTGRANLLGLSEAKGQLVVAEAKISGDLVMIAGRPWPVKVNEQRNKLIARMQQQGFGHTLEAVAYAWFNRLAALRYMEVHNYLGHGRRVLSNPQGGLPEVLTYALDLAETNALPGLSSDKVRELKLANQDPELYRLILIAQCNALHQAMPFLFEQLGDETELLLPENLLLTDSVVTKLVQYIPEEDWHQIEIIGWLYQFYISEKKDQVIGKVVRSEDIPAATQLFTPNWIVQYLVQNSVGRLWLMANPQSTIKSDWRYYIEPAQQAPTVNVQLEALIQARMEEDGGSLNPETITVLDPACGSGHILVEAYDVLKAIYLERGYRPRNIPRLILEKNLYGLDIDDRAAQLAGFALLMKARADDRQLLTAHPRLNILSLQESNGINVDEVSAHLGALGISRELIKDLIDPFARAKTLGSLINIPQALKTNLKSVRTALRTATESQDLYVQSSARRLMPLAEQAFVLSEKFDSVVANPPYMGGKGMNSELKGFAKATFPDSKSDLFAMFMERGFQWCKPSAISSMVTMQSWMFLSSFEQMRVNALRSKTISSLVHMGNGVMGIAFGTVATNWFGAHVAGYVSSFSSCEVGDLSSEGTPKEFPVDNSRLTEANAEDFTRLPASPIVYWLSPNAIRSFIDNGSVSAAASARIGMATGQNARHVRFWHEVEFGRIGLNLTREEAKRSGLSWFPYAKGGNFRRWYGNIEHVVNWHDDGFELQNTLHPDGHRVWAHNFNLNEIFKPALCWTVVTQADTSFRYYGRGFLFDAAAGLLQSTSSVSELALLALLNSKPATTLLGAINPTVNLHPGYLEALPLVETATGEELARKLVALYQRDWEGYETSWNFNKLVLVDVSDGASTLAMAWTKSKEQSEEDVQEAIELETQNNVEFIEAFGLSGEINEKVADAEVALRRPDRESDARRLVSFAVGCMMGRYSLDEPGLIYAHRDNVGFDASRFTKIAADADGILPITDELWFEDAAALRIREFLLAVWGAASLDQNIGWLADSLGRKDSESPDEAVRRYLADKFFKDHLQTYKKRPIYWLFSSGRQGAFQALVYLHRYNAGTLSRLRAEYVVPLTGKMQAKIEALEQDIAASSSTAQRNKHTKQLEKLRKQQLELLAYDEQLRHYADQRITLDLDDGVKVNYGKFGDLLADVKSVVGKQEED